MDMEPINLDFIKSPGTRHAMETLIRAIRAANQPLPIGTVLWVLAQPADVSDPWLVADGSLVSRARYPRLFRVIGEQYGAGDGVSQFALPDLRSEIPMGVATDADGANMSGQTLDRTVGTGTATLTFRYLTPVVLAR